jgi:hypothetical protein
MFDEWSKQIMSTNTAGLQPSMYTNAVADRYDTGETQAAIGNAKIDQANKEEQDAYAESQRKAALAQEELAVKKRMDEVDPKNSRMEPSDDGGYNFFDGAGKAIDINTFARATGTRVNEILKDSQNPNDQKFVRDFEIVQTIANAMVNGDKELIGTMRSQYLTTDAEGNTVDPIGALLEKYRSKTPGDMMNDFKTHWGRMFGGDNAKDASGATPRVIGEPMRQANQLSKEEGAAIAGSTYDQVTAPLNTGAKDLPWWEKASKTIANNWTLGGALTPGVIDEGLNSMSARQKAWEEEKRRRETNPWLSNIYGGQ